jgi:hypothetical protein
MTCDECESEETQQNIYYLETFNHETVETRLKRLWRLVERVCNLQSTMRRMHYVIICKSTRR